MLFTLKLFRSWKACWSDERLSAWLGKRAGVTPRELLDDVTKGSPSDEEKLWAIHRMLDAHYPDLAVEFAVECESQLTKSGDCHGKLVRLAVELLEAGKHDQRAYDVVRAGGDAK